MTVTIVGTREVEAALEAKMGPEADAKAVEGLLEWGKLIQTAARENLKPHYWHGGAERATTVGDPIDTGESVSVSVGIHGGLAPEGRPLELGWASASGLRPPSDAIYGWLTGGGAGTAALSGAGTEVKRTKAGFISGARGSRVDPSDESAVRGLAFVIARAIGKRGLGLGALHWLGQALEDTTAAGEAIFKAVMRL